MGLIANNVIGSDATIVHDLLKEDDYFIPDYQRDFVWETKHISQLWDDLLGHLRKHTINNQVSQSITGYFLGAIVVLDRKEVGHKEVVDGQQRLVALTLMASSLAGFLAKLSPEKTEQHAGVTNNLTSMQGTFKDSTWKPKVRFYDEALSDFFLKSTVGTKQWDKKESYWNDETVKNKFLNHKNTSASRIRDAMLLCRDRIKEYLGDSSDDNENFARVNLLYEILAEYTLVLKITPTNYSTAYQLFESLNYRGFALSQADLIKNEIIKNAKSEVDKGLVSEHWGEIKGVVQAEEPLSLQELLHYYILNRYGRIRAKEVFEAYLERLTSSDSITVMDELLQDSEALESLVAGDTNRWTRKTNLMLEDIRDVLKTNFTFVGLIAAYRKSGDDKKLFETLVRLLLNFSFRFVKVSNGSVSEFGDIMHQVAKMINENRTISDISAYLKTESNDDLFVEDFKKLSVRQTKLAYFIVYYMELYRLSGTEPLEHSDTQHLEHIMPKTPSKKEWPTANKLKTDNPDLYKQYMNRVGNLLPLPSEVNQSIKNKGIATKLDSNREHSYWSTDLKSPPEVKNFLLKGEWTFESIDRRQIWLAENLSAAAWSLDP